MELPSVDVKREKKGDKPEQSKSLTFDDLPKIRDKASTGEVNGFERQVTEAEACKADTA